jgi:hypothetical protein
MWLFVQTLAAYNVNMNSLPRVSGRRCESKESYQDENVFRPERGYLVREMGIRCRVLFNIVLDGAGDLIRLPLAGRFIR